MGIQHFHFVKSFVDKYSNDVEFFILFQGHLDKKLSIFEKIKKLIKKSGFKGLVRRFIDDNKYAKIMNKEKNEYYNSFYPFVNLDTINNLVPKKNILITDNINSQESIAFLGSCNPDLFLLQGGKLIRNEFLQKIKCNILHLHLGIVPLYRGGNSQFWSIYNNAINENGYTVQSVDLGIDTGAIYVREYVNDFNIDDNEHSMYCKTQLKGIESIKKLIDYYLKNTTLPIPIVEKEHGVNYGGNIMVESAKEYVYKNRKRVMSNYIKNKDHINNPIDEINVI